MRGEPSIGIEGVRPGSGSEEHHESRENKNYQKTLNKTSETIAVCLGGRIRPETTNYAQKKVGRTIGGAHEKSKGASERILGIRRERGTAGRRRTYKNKRQLYNEKNRRKEESGPRGSWET